MSEIGRKNLPEASYDKPEMDSSLGVGLDEEDFLKGVKESLDYSTSPVLTPKMRLAINLKLGQRLLSKDCDGCRIIPGPEQDGKVSLLLFDEIGDEGNEPSELNTNGYRGEIVFDQNGTVSVDFTFYDDNGDIHQVQHQTVTCNANVIKSTVAALTGREQLTGEVTREDEIDIAQMKNLMGLKNDEFGMAGLKGAEHALGLVPYPKLFVDDVKSLFKTRHIQPAILSVELSFSKLTGNLSMIDEARVYKEAWRASQGLAEEKKAVDEVQANKQKIEIDRLREAAQAGDEEAAEILQELASQEDQ